MDPIFDNLKEDPITENTKEDVIIGEPIIKDPK